MGGSSVPLPPRAQGGAKGAGLGYEVPAVCDPGAAVAAALLLVCWLAAALFSERQLAGAQPTPAHLCACVAACGSHQSLLRFLCLPRQTIWPGSAGPTCLPRQVWSSCLSRCGTYCTACWVQRQHAWRSNALAPSSLGEGMHSTACRRANLTLLCPRLSHNLQARQLAALAPQLPVEEPRLKSSTYDMVLSALLLNPAGA